MTIIVIDKDDVLDSDTLSLEELDAKRIELDTDADKIAYQIDLAKANVVSDGKFSDPHWFARAQFALKRKRKTAEQLRAIIGQRRKRERQGTRSLSEFFMDVCRERLPEGTYRELLNAARQRMGKLE